VFVRIGIDARKLHDYGIGTYIRNLLRELAAIDRQTEYVLFTRPQDVNLAGTLGENFRAAPDRSGGYSVGEQISIPLAVRRERLDLFHSPHYVLPALTPSKTVVTIHDCIHLVFPEYRQRPLRAAYARASLYAAARKSDRIFTVSEASKRDILKFINVPPDTRERYQLSHSYLLYVGNIKPHKNLERLIEAFHLVRQQGRFELELLIIGDEISKLQALRRAVHKYDIHRYVRFLGYVPDRTLAVLYRLAAVFVFPSLYEGFGLPPLEAMASGTPVVTSNISSMPEVAGDAAVLVDPYSADAIAQGILSVLRSPHFREELRARGLKRVRDFSWARSVQRVREVYGEVLS
jgi:glycosyltransferase involved in cell wall biosynthesis